MKVIGLKEVLIASLQLPGGMKALSETPEVARRANSIRIVGLLHEPIVRQRDMKLLIGRRRVAAYMRDGKDKILVKLVECSDEIAEIATLAENAEREHNPSKANEYYLAMAELIEKQGPPPTYTPGPGRPKTARAIADEMVAKAKGVTPQAIRMAKHRKKQREKKYEAAAEMPGEKPISEVEKWAPPVKTFGLELVPEWCAKVIVVQEKVDAIDILLKEALRTLTKLTREAYSDEPWCMRIYEQVSQAAAETRLMKPVSLCPYCKGLPRVSDECAGCRATGFMVKRDDHDIPPELLDEERLMVSFHGEIVEAQSLKLEDEPAPEPEPAKPANPWGLE